MRIWKKKTLFPLSSIQIEMSSVMIVYVVNIYLLQLLIEKLRILFDNMTLLLGNNWTLLKENEWF